ncbi:BCCT family transporter [Marinobacterium arenosum]|uniref:BCCT family transporter n=1 Tax=Marinobacterium arenosum TaxID=2862496 RepID=UPI001C96277C|nr:BCCT family transporter [Marinobacterium arenosum]MBY4675150.1 BCCT family transporter [Marinobacterium arenosum]
MPTESQRPTAPSGEIDTDYDIGQDNIQASIGSLEVDIHNPVFPISALSVIILVLFCLIFDETAADAFGALRPWLTTQFDWVFAISMNIFVLFCLFLIFSPLGKVKIGGKSAMPEYSYPAWFSMLFAAGMGIGLVFYGVLEPLNHTLTPPLGAPGVLDSDGNLADAATAEAAVRLGMAGTIFHWGLHPWAVYSVVALALALFSYNKGLPLSIRSAFYPILGDRVWGWPGHLIDSLAALATLAGLATSLGYGSSQAAAGLNHVFGIEATIELQVIIIICVTGLALISVVRGLDGGVKLLSEVNMGMALLLFLFVLIFGATSDIFSTLFGGTAAYIINLPALSNWIGREDTGYFHGWTTFYWAWWIAWSPFVGMFIARVSLGRSVREFIICVLLAPTLACVMWMAVFGGTAIAQLVNDGYTGVQQTIANWTPELSLFAMLELLPLSTLTSLLGIVLVLVFFVTSSDSGSLVVDTICAGGKIDAPMPQRVFWCSFEGLVAIALLLGGGLGSLQALAIATGFPFAIVTVAMCYCIYQGLRSEPV